MQKKPWHIMFNKVHAFIRDYYETKYEALSVPEKYDAVYNRIWYSICLKRGIKLIFHHNYARAKISVDDLALAKPFTLHNDVILIKFLLKIKICTITIYS